MMKSFSLMVHSNLSVDKVCLQFIIFKIIQLLFALKLKPKTIWIKSKIRRTIPPYPLPYISAFPWFQSGLQVEKVWKVFGTHNLYPAQSKLTANPKTWNTDQKSTTDSKFQKSMQQKNIILNLFLLLLLEQQQTVISLWKPSCSLVLVAGFHWTQSRRDCQAPKPLKAPFHTFQCLAR